MDEKHSRLPVAEKKRRMRAVQTIMVEKEIDGAFIQDPVNLLYLLGEIPKCLVYLPQKGDLCKLYPQGSRNSPGLLFNRLETIPYILGSEGYPLPDRVALEGGAMTRSDWQYTSSLIFACEAVDMPVCTIARERKSLWEQKQIRSALQKATSILHRKQSICELEEKETTWYWQAEANQYQEMPEIWSAEGEYRQKIGDAMWRMVRSAHGSYGVELGLCGFQNEEESRGSKADLLWQRVSRAAKTGVLTGELYALALETVASWGEQENFLSQSAGRHCIGSGFGLLTRERPEIAFGRKEILQEGMALSIRICFREEDGKARGIQRIVIVEKESATRPTT